MLNFSFVGCPLVYCQYISIYSNSAARLKSAEIINSKSAEIINS
jgi:hypothetical protein